MDYYFYLVFKKYGGVGGEDRRKRKDSPRIFGVRIGK